MKTKITISQHELDGIVELAISAVKATDAYFFENGGTGFTSSHTCDPYFKDLYRILSDFPKDLESLVKEKLYSDGYFDTEIGEFSIFSDLIEQWW